MSDDAKNDQKEASERIYTEALTAQDEALLEFGRQLLTKSLNSLTDFSKLMITLCTGLISVYLAILKFLGIEKAIEEIGTIMSILAIIGPLILIVSMIFFILAILPLKVSISLIDIENVRDVRKKMLDTKHRNALIGVILFFCGFLVMVFSIYLILLPTDAFFRFGDC